VLSTPSYRLPAPNEPISQGDIFRGVALITTLTDQHLVFDGEVYRAEPVGGDLEERMLLLSQVTLVDAIVIDQSCDAPGGPQVLFAPLVSFTPDGKGEAQWRHISRVATSLSDPTRFYLPDEPELDLGRHLAEFEGKFPLPLWQVEKDIRRGKRVATLSAEALAFLQFRLTAMYGRAAREDYAWPSLADLGLKHAHLLKQAESKAGEIKGWQKKAEQENTPPEEKQRLLVRIEVQDRRLQALKQEMERCAQVIEERIGGVADVAALAARRGEDVVAIPEAAHPLQPPHAPGRKADPAQEEKGLVVAVKADAPPAVKDPADKGEKPEPSTPPAPPSA
jgi:hypothetical protein